MSGHFDRARSLSNFALSNIRPAKVQSFENVTVSRYVSAVINPQC